MKRRTPSTKPSTPKPAKPPKPTPERSANAPAGKAFQRKRKPLPTTFVKLDPLPELLERAARIAYEGQFNYRQGKNLTGDPLMDWDHLPDEMKHAHAAGVWAVISFIHPGGVIALGDVPERKA